MRKLLSIIIVSMLATLCSAQITYTFNGNGNWSDSTNWANQLIPPEVLKSGSEIIIDPVINGKCVLDTSQIIATGAVLTIKSGKKIEIRGQLAQRDSSDIIGQASFINDTTERYTGADTASLEDLMNLPILEADSFLFEPPISSGRISSELPMPPINLPNIGNQRQFNSCVGWAVGYAVLSYWYKFLEKNSSYAGLDKKFSPSFIWNQLNRGQNSFISIPDAIRLVENIGCSKYFDMAPDISIPSSRPSNAAFNNAFNYRVGTHKLVYPFQVSTFKELLDRRIPIIALVEIDEDFKHQSPMSFLKKTGERWVWVNKSGKDNKNHAMVICGYDDAIQSFKLMNSWGTESRYNGGFVWIKYDLFLQQVRKHYSGNNVYPECYYLGFKKKAVTVTTNPYTDLTATGISISGNVIVSDNTAIWETGVCYSTFEDPTTACTSPNNISVIAENTAGSFTASITGLQPSQHYYARAFARTDKGIVYGDNIEFTTTEGEEGEFTDPRDGQVYTYKTIGTQVWMTQNLNYVVSGSWCYDDDHIFVPFMDVCMNGIRLLQQLLPDGTSPPTQNGKFS